MSLCKPRGSAWGKLFGSVFFRFFPSFLFLGFLVFHISSKISSMSSLAISDHFLCIFLELERKSLAFHNISNNFSSLFISNLFLVCLKF